METTQSLPFHPASSTHYQSSQSSSSVPSSLICEQEKDVTHSSAQQASLSPWLFEETPQLLPDSTSAAKQLSPCEQSMSAEELLLVQNPPSSVSVPTSNIDEIFRGKSLNGMCSRQNKQMFVICFHFFSYAWAQRWPSVI